MIAARNLRFRYPDATIDTLAGIDVNIGGGEIVLLAGQSGSGKSSLLRCLNGLIPHFHGGHFAGEVVVDGSNTRTTTPSDLARSVGSVFQDPESQLVTDSADDEIAFALENLGFTGDEIERRIEDICARLAIEHLRDRRISTLSGGERQMVAIAAALAPSPPILILDEPTSQLDPEASQRILAALAGLRDAAGLTVIIAEHRIARVLPLADTVLLMQAGSLMRYTPGNALPALQVAGLAPWERADCPARPPQSAPALAELDDICFSYGERRVLDGANLAIFPGETVALLGSNGSGKTTLLKHLIGLLRPASGTVRVLGRDIRPQAVHELARSVGYVPQQASLILHRESVESELRFTLDSLGRAGAPGDILRALGIDRHAARHPLDLSGGERQRVAIAALAVGSPRLLLLDEPTRGLPWSEKLNLAMALRAYAERGNAVLVATHDLDFAAVFGQRAVQLLDGRIAPHEYPASGVFESPFHRKFSTSLLTPSKTA